MANISAVGLHPLEQIVNVQWGGNVWFFSIHTKGVAISYGGTVACSCPIMGDPPTQTVTRNPAGELVSGYSYTFAGTYDPYLGELYRSTDGFQWEKISVPNTGAGLNELRFINGEGVIASAPGGTSDAVCSCNCGDVSGHVASWSYSCGTNAVDGASSSYSEDKGKTWISLYNSTFTSGIKIADAGADAASDGEKITITVHDTGPGPGDTSETFNLTTPWPANKYRDPILATDKDGKPSSPPDPYGRFGLGVGTGNIFVRAKSSDDNSKLELETSTDKGQTYATTFSITGDPGFLGVVTLLLQVY